MIVNLKQFLFEQLDKERLEKRESINNIIYENFTPRELELKSLSNQSGKVYITEDGTKLIFSKPSSEAIGFKLEHSLDELILNDTINCVMEECHNINLSKSDILSSYNGGGTLTLHTGVEFQFTTPIYEGKYFLEERTGFNSSKVTLTKIE